MVEYIIHMYVYGSDPFRHVGDYFSAKNPSPTFQSFHQHYFSRISDFAKKWPGALTRIDTFAYSI